MKTEVRSRFSIWWTWMIFLILPGLIWSHLLKNINFTTVWIGIVNGMTWQGLAMVTVGWGGAGEGRGTTESGVSYRCWWRGIGELKSNLVDKEIICGWPWWTQLQIYNNNTYCGAIYLLSTEKMNIENTILLFIMCVAVFVICKSKCCIWYQKCPSKKIRLDLTFYSQLKQHMDCAGWLGLHHISHHLI